MAMALPDGVLRIDARCGAIIPYDYRTDLQKLIYHVLDGSWAGMQAHTRGEYSLFTFGLLPQEPAIYTPEGLAADGGLWHIYVASAYRDFLALLHMNWPKSFALGGRVMTRRQVAMEPIVPEQPLYAHHILMFGNEHDGMPFLPYDHPEFWARGKAGLINRYVQWARVAGETRDWAPSQINIAFAAVPRKKLIDYRGRRLLTFSGRLAYNMPPELLAFARCVGLGQKPSAGLGIVLPILARGKERAAG